MKTLYTGCMKALFALSVIVMLSLSSSFSQGCLDATFHLESNNNTTHFFRGDEVIDYVWGTGASTPADMNSQWSGLSPWTGIDAALKLSDSRVFLYRGNEMANVNSATGAVLNAPAPITNFINFFPANFQEGLDAAFAWSNGQDTMRLFYFKGTECLRVDYDVSASRFFNVQPATTISFDGVFTTHFTEGVDAAFYYALTRKVYFFRGNQYIRYDAATGKVDSGYPAVTSSNWTGLTNDWSCIDPVINNNCNIDYKIPDHSCSDANEVEVNVTAPGTALGTDIEVDGMVFYIEHPYLSDLTISLISPSGKEVLLVGSKGGSGNDFGTGCAGNELTIIDRNATQNWSDGTAPFVGAFKPEGNLDDFNDGSDPNGIWKLKMCDGGNNDEGVLRGLRINFNALSTGLEDVLETGLGLAVSPNPSQGNILVQLAQNSPHAIDIKIIDAMGKTVFEHHAPQAGTSFKQHFALSHLSNGLYFVHAQRGDKVATERILIQH